jgi:hypothetical protein
MDDHTTFANITPEFNYNNIFSIENDFLKELLKDTIQLVAPEDFDPNKFDEENNAAIKQLEEKKNNEVDMALKILTEITLTQNPKELKGFELRSLTRFKKEINSNLKDS